MFSQARSTRYIIMAIVIVTGLMFAAPRSGHTLSFDFMLTDTLFPFGTGILTVDFSGADKPPLDGILQLDLLDPIINEVTALEVTWTNTSSGIGDFSFVKADLDLIAGQLFEYDISSGTVSPVFPNFVLVSSSIVASVTCAMPCQEGELVLLRLVDASDLFSIMDISPSDVAPIPEPSTWLLFSTGLVGVIGYAFSRRVRSAAPRRTPGTSA